MSGGWVQRIGADRIRVGSVNAGELLHAGEVLLGNVVFGGDALGATVVADELMGSIQAGTFDASRLKLRIAAWMKLISMMRSDSASSSPRAFSRRSRY